MSAQFIPPKPRWVSGGWKGQSGQPGMGTRGLAPPVPAAWLIPTFEKSCQGQEVGVSRGTQPCRTLEHRL